MSDVAEPDRPDVVLLLEACSAWADDQVLRSVRSEVGDDVRHRDGYVFQHLVDGPCSITELAQRLGVTQQAASKQVDDLVRRGLVLRRRDPDDARVRLLSLSDRGTLAVESGRRARRRVVDDLAREMGEGSLRSLTGGLESLSDRTGALQRLLDRRLRPEEGR